MNTYGSKERCEEGKAHLKIMTSLDRRGVPYKRINPAVEE